jgi:diacylglycerol kinase
MKIKKIIKSFGYASEGVKSSFKSETNMKIHISIMFLVIIMGFLLNIKVSEWLVCVILFGIVISAELFNTAIETVVDMISPEYSKQAKLAKDISAGAVLVLAISSVIIGLIIFIPKIISFLI